MGCPRLFSKNHDFYVFITWGYCIAIGHLLVCTSEWESYSSSQTMQCMTILAFQYNIKIWDHGFGQIILHWTHIDGFLSHWCIFHKWPIATDYQCGRYCTSVKNAKSHLWTVYHCRSVTKWSWPLCFVHYTNCNEYLFFVCISNVDCSLSYCWDAHQAHAHSK